MGTRVRRVEYFYATVQDKPGQAYSVLAQLADAGVALLAFSVIPMGSTQTQLVLFPEIVETLAAASKRMGLNLSGQQQAFLIQGDDQLGALVEMHRMLYEADVNVYASSGVTDGVGGYGYILYVKPEAYERAARVLGV
jgi:hypothetical protein